MEDLENAQSRCFLADHLRILVNNGPRKELILWQTGVLLDQIRFTIIWLAFSNREKPCEEKSSLRRELYGVYRRLTFAASSIENKETRRFREHRCLLSADGLRRRFPTEREAQEMQKKWQDEQRIDLIEKSREGLSLLKKFDQVARGEDRMDQVTEHLNNCALYDGYDILNRMACLEKTLWKWSHKGEIICDYLKRFFLLEAELGLLEEDFQKRYPSGEYPSSLNPEALHHFLQIHERLSLSGK